MQWMFGVSLAMPAIWLVGQIGLDLFYPGSYLGPDAGETVVHYLGQTALIILLLAYSVSPLRRLTGITMIARQRRQVGLFAFTYVCLHALSYLAFYLEFVWSDLLDDFSDRLYIAAGLGSLVCLTLMAATSTRGWQRRMRRYWRVLHRLVYPAVGLALLHLWWLTRDGYGEVVLYSLWFLVLSIERLWHLPRFKRGWPA